MNIDHLPELLTPREAAAVLRVTTKTLARYDISGMLHAQKTLGGRRRYRRAELQAFLDVPGDPQPEAVT